MKNWPSEHRLALALALILLMAAGGAYFFLVRPEAVAVRDIRYEHAGLLKDLKEKVKDSGYPLDSTRLRAHAASRRSVLDGVTRKRADGTEYNTGLISRANRVLEHATSMFDEQIKQEYKDIHSFMQASSIVYMDELDQLTRDLSNKNIFLVEDVLGIGVDTTDVDTYELLLKVWTVRKVVKILVDDHGLTIENRRLPRSPDEEGARSPLAGMLGGRRARFASEVSVLPTRSYVLEADDKEPYVLEFPVRIRFQGPLPTVCEAIESLQSDGTFLTANRFVLETEDPSLMVNRRPGSDGMVRTRNVVVTLEVSSYFRLSREAPKIHVNRANLLPKGA